MGSPFCARLTLSPLDRRCRLRGCQEQQDWPGEQLHSEAFRVPIERGIGMPDYWG